MNFEEWEVRFSRGKQNQGIFVVIWNISFSSKDRSAYCRTELINDELCPALITEPGKLEICPFLSGIEHFCETKNRPGARYGGITYRKVIMLYRL